MDNSPGLRTEIKSLMIRELMMKVGVGDIGDATPLFGPDGLGLDSIDALQLVVALDKQYGVKLADPDAARRVLASVNTIAEAVVAARAAAPANP